MELKDFLNSINHGKNALLDKDEHAIRYYEPFVVNKCLSYFIDTVFHSNEMNCLPWLCPKAQYDFYRIAVRKKKRFSHWIKKEKEQNVALIKEVYGYTDSKAREVLNILSEKDLEVLKQSLEKGGVGKGA